MVKISWVIVVAAFFIGMAAPGTLAAEGKVSQVGNVTVYTPPSQASQAGDTIDYANAKPMPLPTVDVAPPDLFDAEPAFEFDGSPGITYGTGGNGKMSPVRLPSQGVGGGSVGAADEVSPQEFGTSNHPFTTSRVDLYSNNESKVYPYRIAGKLYFKIGSSTYVCSASLIKRGLAVTAAHCVANFGKKQFYTSWNFIPAMYGSTAPYGQWSVSRATVMTKYYDGTDSCYQKGVVCQNDIAVLTLTAKSGTYPGTSTGWFGYGWNGWGFNSSKYALINQLGYPVSHDSGVLMQRTDSQGFVSSTMSGNTVWGTRQTGGSSGGPELVNLGKAASLSGVSYGTYGTYNIVVGVTSWGYTDLAKKQQGASPFLSSNIPVLVTAGCASPYQAACQ